jgi:hypothetical protein
MYEELKKTLVNNNNIRAYFPSKLGKARTNIIPSTDKISALNTAVL